MARFALSVALLLALVPVPARALEFTNVRPSYGPLGATRTDADNLKCLPGDILFISYEIDGLKLDPKANKAVYVTLLEVFDNNAKTIFKKETPNEVIPQLGGTRIPGDLHVIMGRNQNPGKYHVASPSRTASRMTPSRSSAPSSSCNRASAWWASPPAVAFPGQPYMANFAVVDFGLDAMKNPKAKIEMKILDESGKLASPAMTNTLPADLPENVDLKKENFLPANFPIFPNRPGRFTIEIIANDLVSQKTASVRYPLTVIDITSLTSK